MALTEEEKRAFFAAIERFNRYWPALDAALTKAFYTNVPVHDQNTITMAGIGKQCADAFEEIHSNCSNGYGLAGTKLLRGLYERTVTAAYFAVKPEAAAKFIDWFALDFGRLIHRHEEFASTQGLPADMLPAELRQRIERDFKQAKKDEEKCENCGAPKGRVDVLSMAQAATPELVPYYGLCFLEPTLHVHCTWYSILEGIKVRGDENHLDFEPHPEGERAVKTLQLSHFVILYSLKTQNAYFRLGLDEGIAQCRNDYDKLWERESPVAAG